MSNSTIFDVLSPAVDFSGESLNSFNKVTDAIGITSSEITRLVFCVNWFGRFGYYFRNTFRTMNSFILASVSGCIAICAVEPPKCGFQWFSAP